MLQKQAIWCHCATLPHTALTLACIASIQTMTLAVDVFWALLLTIATIITFAAAEHTAIGVFTPVHLIRLEQIRNNVITATLVWWSTGIVYIPVYIVATLVTTVALEWIPPKITYISSMLWLVSCSPLWVGAVAIVWTLAQWWSDQWFRDTLHKSTASTELKYAYAAKSVKILSEGLLLWHIRCFHRFPHTFRWTPVLFGGIFMTMGVIYSSLLVADTETSRNAIIKRNGHGMAASLATATACPLCKTCLSALDMESSFSD